MAVAHYGHKECVECGQDHFRSGDLCMDCKEGAITKDEFYERLSTVRKIKKKVYSVGFPEHEQQQRILGAMAKVGMLSTRRLHKISNRNDHKEIF